MVQNLLKDLSENQNAVIETTAEKNYVETRVSISITKTKGILKTIFKYSCDVTIGEEGNVAIDNIDNYDTYHYMYGLEVYIPDMVIQLQNAGVINANNLFKIPAITDIEVKKYVLELDEIKKLLS